MRADDILLDSIALLDQRRLMTRLYLRDRRTYIIQEQSWIDPWQIKISFSR